MSKVNYKDVMDDDPQQPCQTCASIEAILDWETNSYSCLKCGEPLITSMKPNKHEKRVKKKVRREEDWR